MKNELLKDIFSLSNRKDIETYAENIVFDIKNGNKYFPLSCYFEAMQLYNMYIDAMKEEDLKYLYPFKLQKVIEIANEASSALIFKKRDGSYYYTGEIKMNELDGVLEVLIDYSNLPLLIKIMSLVLPYIKQIKPLENFYISLCVMKFKHIELPKKIGDLFLNDYLDRCYTSEFYQNARTRLKKTISLDLLPAKAKAMYFQLSSLYTSLESSQVFDFGVISMQCFKIMEVCTKDLIEKALVGLSDTDIYDILPQDLKDHYKRDKFNIGRIEIGKIYYLVENIFDKNDSLSNKLKLVFKNTDAIDKFKDLINPKTIAQYRNGPAHGEYMSQESAIEVKAILDKFINEFLYMVKDN